MGCIHALDWMPGCSWPLWLQMIAAAVLLLIYWIGRMAIRRRYHP